MKYDVRGPTLEFPASWARSRSPLSDHARQSTSLSTLAVVAGKMLAALARSSQAAFCSVRPAVGAIRALVGKRTAATQAPYFANTKIPSRPRLLDSSWNPVNQAIQESTKTPDEIWAQREPTVATLGRPNGPFFGTCASKALMNKSWRLMMYRSKCAG